MGGITGCQTATELTPAPDAQPFAGLGNAAEAQTQGVSIVAQAGDWPGDAAIERHVTPLRVEIENNSEMPLRVRYNDFALVNENDGRHFAALPPYAIDGTVKERVVAEYDRPIHSIGFRHRGFRVSPFYDGVYPRLRYYSRPFHYDPFYYDHYSSYWIDMPLPTEDMLRRVIPEGVIEPGGTLGGFLYFERVPNDLNRVEFNYELTNADTGENFGMVGIPFLVNGE